MAIADYPNVTRWTDRLGKPRYRYRRSGMPTFNFSCTPDDVEFEAEYALATSGHPRPAPTKTARRRIEPKDRFEALRQFEGRSVVYIVGAALGPVKIGWSTDVYARVRDLQTAQHRTLFVHAILDGGRFDEMELHRRFARDRVRGEWFRLSSDLHQYLTDSAPNLHPRLGKKLRKT